MYRLLLKLSRGHMLNILLDLLDHKFCNWMLLDTEYMLTIYLNLLSFLLDIDNHLRHEIGMDHKTSIFQHYLGRKSDNFLYIRYIMIYYSYHKQSLEDIYIRYQLSLMFLNRLNSSINCLDHKSSNSMLNYMLCILMDVVYLLYIQLRRDKYW
jgi:hypothetical protein